MRDLTFQLYRSHWDRLGKSETRSWEDWVKVFSSHQVIPSDGTDVAQLNKDKNKQCVVLGQIAEGKTRAKKNVTKVHALGLDLEGLADEQVEEFFVSISEFEWATYTTHKHRAPVVDEQARYRIIFPLAEIVYSDMYEAVWQAFDYLTGGVNDPSTKDVSRLHYLPTSWNEEVYESFRNEGRWLSAKDDLLSLDIPEVKLHNKKEVAALRAALKRAKDEDLREACKNVLAGKPYAEKDTRHDTALKLTMYIALQGQKRFKPFSEEALTTVFGPSLRRMDNAEEDAPGLSDLLAGYVTALDKVEEEVDDDILLHQLAYAEDEPYTADDLAEIAEKQGCSVEELRHRWIVQRGRSYYVLGADGDYSLQDQTDVGSAIDLTLSRAPVDLYEMTKNGLRQKSIRSVVSSYGALCRAVVADMRVQNSYYDPETQKMHEAVTPLANLEPEFNQRIDDYFKVMAGENYDRLCDWLACVPDLTKMLCIVYVVGPRGVFKTGLANGLAQLWPGGTPTPLKTILGNFNENLVNMSPLVLADESLPKQWKGDILGELREMISVTTRPLNRKYYSSSQLLGALRVMLCANDEFLLQSPYKQPSREEVEATAERFLYIQVPEEALEWKTKHISEEEAKAWSEHGGFARHALWLYQNREVEQHGRFWVEGDLGHMHSLLLCSSEFNSLANLWLLRYLQNPERVDQLNSGLIRRDSGEFFVNDRALLDFWDIYHPKTFVEPKPTTVRDALRAISHKGTQQRRWGGGDNKIRYRKINLDDLGRWADAHMYSDPEELKALTFGKRLNRKEEAGSKEIFGARLAGAAPE